MHNLFFVALRGYEDLVVGAPYDGTDQRGAIYIYLGSAEGIIGKAAQVIYASDINRQLRTFGWSLSAGMDLDRNQYPDLLIGAYESSNAVYLRSAPVVHVNAQINFRTTERQINLDVKNCQKRDGTKVPCVDFESAIFYGEAPGAPDTISTFNYILVFFKTKFCSTINVEKCGTGNSLTLHYSGLQLSYVLDSKKDKTKRMFFLSNESHSVLNKTINIRKGKTYEDTHTVYLSGPNIHDKLTSLDIQVI